MQSEPLRLHAKSAAKASFLAAVAASQGLSGYAQSDDARAEPRDDEDPERLADVVVRERAVALSSPKFTAPLLDTPQTLTVLPSEMLELQGSTNLSDALRNTPGITFSAGEGGGVAAGDAFYMRGFDASGSIFVDGVRDSGAYFRDVYNVEQIEIAKGPAGADSGRGGASGYVNLATKTPGPSAFANAQLTYGAASDGEPQKRATIDYNRPVDETFSLRLNALYQDAGIPGRDIAHTESFGIAPSVAIQLGEDSRLVLTGAYEEQDGITDNGMPVVALPQFGLGVDQSNFYGLARHDFEKVENVKLGIQYERDLGNDLQLHYQTRYIDTDRDMLYSRVPNSSSTYYDPLTQQITVRVARRPETSEILAHQLNLSGRAQTGDIGHSFSAGLEATSEERRNETWTTTNGPVTSLRNPDPYRAVSGDQLPVREPNGAYSQGQIDTLAAYAFDTIRFSERWQANLSARFEKYDIEYDALAANGARTDLSTDKDLFSYKAGLVYKPVADASLYIAYANSDTPPGSAFTLNPSTATTARPDDPLLSPQESVNYEAGIKWDLFEQRLSTSLAFYRSENRNVASVDAVTGEITQDISQVAEGVELGVSGRITRDWMVFGGLGYIDTSYETDGTTAEGNDGAELRFTPRLSGNLWTTYNLTEKLTIGGGLQYADSVARSTSNTVEDTATSIAEVPDYWIVNLMAAYAVNESLTLRLNVNNAFDEEYFRLNNNGGRYYPGEVRNAELTANLSF